MNNNESTINNDNSNNNNLHIVNISYNNSNMDVIENSNSYKNKLNYPPYYYYNYPPNYFIQNYPYQYNLDWGERVSEPHVNDISHMFFEMAYYI